MGDRGDEGVDGLFDARNERRVVNRSVIGLGIGSRVGFQEFYKRDKHVIGSLEFVVYYSKKLSTRLSSLCAISGIQSRRHVAGRNLFKEMLGNVLSHLHDNDYSSASCVFPRFLVNNVLELYSFHFYYHTTEAAWLRPAYSTKDIQ
jgi:hypothetical protein